MRVLLPMPRPMMRAEGYVAERQLGPGFASCHFTCTRRRNAGPSAKMIERQLAPLHHRSSHLVIKYGPKPLSLLTFQVAKFSPAARKQPRTHCCGHLGCCLQAASTHTYINHAPARQGCHFDRQQGSFLTMCSRSARSALALLLLVILGLCCSTAMSAADQSAKSSALGGA
jgi:hypothetical protein